MVFRNLQEQALKNSSIKNQSKHHGGSMKSAPRIKVLSLILSLAILFSLVTPVSAVTEKKPAPSSSTQQVNQIMSRQTANSWVGLKILNAVKRMSNTTF
jgi:hypothetical protein